MRLLDGCLRVPALAHAATLMGDLAVASLTLAAQTPGAGTDDTRVPGATWTTVTPASAGYSSARFEILRAWLKTLDTKAMLVAYR